MPVADGSAGTPPRRPPPRVISGTHFQPSTTSGGQYSSASGGGAPSPPSPSYSAPVTYGNPPAAPRIAPSGGGPSGPAGGGNNNGGGGGGGNNNGGGGHHQQNQNKGPQPPSIVKYLGTDEQYQQDRAGLLKNFRNLRLANIENQGNVQEDRSTTISRLKQEQEDAARAMANDFAARGLYGGAEYLNKEQDFNEDYLNQRQDARESAARNITQLLRDLENAKTLKNENLQQARLEAIRRRAAQYGIKG